MPASFGAGKVKLREPSAALTVALTVLALPAPEGGVMVITGFSEVWYPEPVPE